MDTRYIFDARLYDAATRARLAGGDPWQVEIAGNYRGSATDAPPLVPFALLPPDLGYLGARARRRGRCGRQCVDPPSAVVVAVVSATCPKRYLGQRPESAGALDPCRRWPRRSSTQGLRRRPTGHPWSLAGAHRAGWRPARYGADPALAGVPRQPRRNRRATLEPERERAPESPAGRSPGRAPRSAVGRERAAWLAVPAIWPAQQFYYGTLVCRRAARSPPPSWRSRWQARELRRCSFSQSCHGTREAQHYDYLPPG